jgi:pSer/pThr/pTyr-binding forkhead associated (FHA) protein
MQQIFLRAVAGAIGGAITWLAVEPFTPSDYNDPRWNQVSLILMVLLGALVGLFVGGLNGHYQGSRAHMVRGMILGVLLGAFGSLVGTSIGSRAVATLFHHDPFDGSVPLPVAIVARMMALTPIGTFIGLGIGAASGNTRRAAVGALGGTLGGLLAGASFDVASGLLAGLTVAFQNHSNSTHAEVGITGRAILCLLVGAGVGFFTGIVDRATRVAWLRLVLGRNEGREWVVDAPQTIIGRSETANVPLFGDMSIAPVHATITRQGDSYILSDNGSPTGTTLNGQPVTQVPLFNGAVIGVGTFKLEFAMRAGSAPQRSAEALRSQQAYPLQQGVAALPFAPQPAAAGPIGQMPMPIPMVQPAPSQPMQMPMAQQTVSAPELVAIAGPLTGQRFALLTPIEIGREAAGISLPFDSMASRKHAMVALVPGGVTVTDLGSTNGTFVNDQRVQAATLNRGDLVRIGISTFRFE